MQTRTTITIAEDVLRAVRLRAARTGQRDSQVIEAALRRDLGLDLLDELWAGAELDEDEAMALAREAQQRTRAGRDG
ncbi:MAG: hypothetical protein ACI970_000730 [Myxococcota bacterium]|jgi:hypothetical protein